MGILRLIVGIIGVALLLVGIGSVWVLFQIKGSSDGPGAIMFYLGALFGLGGAWVMFSLSRAFRVPESDES